MARGNRYAEGKHALGECARSGRKMLLKDMVADGYYPNLIVDPAWREEKHPQEYLPMVEDPVSLYRPSPERLLPPSTPTLSGEQNSTSQVTLSWTESITARSQIMSYDLYRKVGDGAYSLLVTIDVERDDFGGITGNPLTHVDDTVDLSSNAYTYRVQAQTVQGPPSALSNEVLFEQSTGLAFVVTVGEFGSGDQYGYSHPDANDFGAIDPDPASLDESNILINLSSTGSSFFLVIADDGEIPGVFTTLTIETASGDVVIDLTDPDAPQGSGVYLWADTLTWNSDDLGSDRNVVFS